MRSSCYLNAVEIGDGNSLLYNGLSLCIDVVPSDIARNLIAYKEGGDFSFLLTVEKEHLLKRGHLTELTIKDEQEEMGRLARGLAERDVKLHRERFREKTITFILTYACNLSCAYCYQSEIRKTADLSPMSANFVDDFFCTYFDKLLAGERRNGLSFSLYGGEPLLPGNRGAIEQILRYAQQYGIGVSTVTNAVMLPDMLDLIGPEEGKINNVQVTLDGGQMFHDTKRLSQSGGPTFDQTILAVRELMKAGANAVIRVHLHPDRLDSAAALVEYLEREDILGHDRVTVYFWSMEDLHSRALSLQQYNLFSQLFERVALKQDSVPTAHFAFLQDIMEMKTVRSRPIRRHCDICVSGLHCVVDPVGDIYECVDDAGHPERRVATLADGEVNYLKRSEAYDKVRLCDKPECLKCSIALYCGGGCINRMKTQDESLSASFCPQVREFVALTLRSHFLLKKNGAPAN